MKKVSDLLEKLQGLRGKRGLAVLLDPDKVDEQSLSELIINALSVQVDLFLVGGSLISSDKMDWLLEQLENVPVPTLLFPGNAQHIHPKADGILLLSLISGRNPDFLIGQHVIAAHALKRSGLAIIPTGYMLVDGGKQTTASYISNTTPLPNNKPDIAAATALAGELLGLKMLYLDAGSGAAEPVNPALIRGVKAVTSLPLFVGGGINTIEKALSAYEAGADLIVIGNALEKDPSFLQQLGEIKKQKEFLK